MEQTPVKRVFTLLLDATWASLIIGCVPQRPASKGLVPSNSSSVSGTHEDTVDSSQGRVDISSPLLGTVHTNDGGLEEALNTAWQEKQNITWYTPERSVKGIWATQQLPGDQTRTAWFQPGMMWVDDRPFTGEAVEAFWRGASARIVTARAPKEISSKADSIVLVAAGVPSKLSATLNAGQRARLTAILAAADSFQLEDDFYASPTAPSAPGYEFHIRYLDHEFTLKLMSGSESGQDIVLMYNLWGGGPDQLFMAPGLKVLARQILPSED